MQKYSMKYYHVYEGNVPCVGGLYSRYTKLSQRSKSVCIIHHINRLKNNQMIIIIIIEKSIWENSKPIHGKKKKNSEKNRKRRELQLAKEHLKKPFS